MDTRLPALSIVLQMLVAISALSSRCIYLCTFFTAELILFVCFIQLADMVLVAILLLASFNGYYLNMPFTFLYLTWIQVNMKLLVFLPHKYLFFYTWVVLHQ